jgi:hypothetical protein
MIPSGRLPFTGEKKLNECLGVEIIRVWILWLKASKIGE